MPMGTGMTFRARGMCGLPTMRRRLERAGIPTVMETGCITRHSVMSGRRDIAGVTRRTSAGCGISMMALAGAGLRVPAAIRGGVDLVADLVDGGTTSDMRRMGICLPGGQFPDRDTPVR